jgi:hypothetical protein
MIEKEFVLLTAEFQTMTFFDIVLLKTPATSLSNPKTAGLQK